MTYVLVLMLWWGGRDGGRAITNVPGFKTQESCEIAGKTAQQAPKSSALEYVCLKQP